MTTREDRIETAARALATMPWSAGGPTQIAVRPLAARVVDAVLPQITTAEQLEALPIWAVALDGYGQPWTRVPEGWQHLACGPIKARTVQPLGPLTVVWQPQPDQETTDA